MGEDQQSDSYKLTIRIKEEEEGGYSGQCLEFPAAITQGETIEELKKNMIEAIQLVIENIKSKAKVNRKEDKIITLDVPVPLSASA